MTLVRAAGPRASGWLAGALGGLVLAVVVAAVLLQMRISDAERDAAAYDDVRSAARKEAAAFTNVDYRDIEADIEAVLAGATGKFKREFAANADNLKSTATANQAISRGRVLSVGVVTVDSDSARAIVVADSQVSNIQLDEPQPRHYRLQLDLRLVGGRWLTYDVQFVG